MALVPPEAKQKQKKGLLAKHSTSFSASMSL
jgi:hypothetical protein